MFVRSCRVFAAFVFPLLVTAQGPSPETRPLAYRVSTYAGIPWTVAGPAKAPTVMLKLPLGVACDRAGNTYIANYEMHLVRRVDPSGEVTTIAGDGYDSRVNFFGESPQAALRRLTFPRSLAVDGTRFLYIAEPIVSRIKRVNLETNEVAIIVGGRGAGFSPDGTPGVDARINEVLGLAVDAQGDLLIAETGSHRIRKWSAATGLLSTVAGGDRAGFSGDDGPATSATLNRPSAVAVHPGGDIYFFDFENRRVRRIRSGTIATVAGTPNGTVTQGPGAQVNFGASTGIAVDAEGRNLFITSETSHRIFKLQLSDMTVSVFSGTGVAGRGNADGIPAVQATYFTPTGVATDAQGGVVVADANNHKIRRIGPDGVVRTLAGLSRYGLEGSVTPDKAVFDGITSLRVDSRGTLIVSESANCMIRSVISNLVSIAFGQQGSCMPALASLNSAILDNDRNLFYLTGQGLFFRPVTGGNPVLRMNNPGIALALSRDGNTLFYLDASRGWVYSVNRTTVLTSSAAPTLIAGFPGRGEAVDGPVQTARFTSPSDIAQTANGDLYIADFARIRRIRSGTVSTFGPQFQWSSVTVDSADTVWAASFARAFKSDAEGRFVYLLGPTSGFATGLSPDGATSQAVRFGGNVLLAAGRNGVIYIADTANNVIRQAVPVAIESLTKVDGDNQTGVPGGVLPAPLRTRVIAADGAPLFGVPVQFKAPHLTQPIAVETDVEGYANLPLMPLPATAGKFTVTAEAVVSPALPAVTFTVDAAVPGPEISSVAVAADYGAGAGMSGGSRLEIRGARLADVGVEAAGGAAALGGVRVLMNDVPATLLSVGPDRIVCVAPESLAAGSVAIAVVTENGGPASKPFVLEFGARAPALLLAPAEVRAGGKPYVYAQIEGGGLAGPADTAPNAQPAAAGQKLSFVASGLGAAPTQATIRFGDAEPVTAEITAAELSTYRIDAVVPAAAAGAGDVRVRITVDGVEGTQLVLTAIQ